MPIKFADGISNLPVLRTIEKKAQQVEHFAKVKSNTPAKGRVAKAGRELRQILFGHVKVQLNSQGLSGGDGGAGGAPGSGLNDRSGEDGWGSGSVSAASRAGGASGSNRGAPAIGTHGDDARIPLTKPFGDGPSVTNNFHNLSDLGFVNGSTPDDEIVTIFNNHSSINQTKDQKFHKIGDIFQTDLSNSDAETPYSVKTDEEISKFILDLVSGIDDDYDPRDDFPFDNESEAQAQVSTVNSDEASESVSGGTNSSVSGNDFAYLDVTIFREAFSSELREKFDEKLICRSISSLNYIHDEYFNGEIDKANKTENQKKIDKFSKTIDIKRSEILEAANKSAGSDGEQLRKVSDHLGKVIEEANKLQNLIKNLPEL